MKRISVAVFVTCLLCTGVAHAAPAAPTSKQQIQSLLDEMLTAANAHDTDRFMALYLHEPSLVYVDNGMVIHGWENLRAQQLKWWKNGKSDAVYRQNGANEFTVLAPGIVAVTEPRASTRTMPGGKTGNNEFVVSEIWQKLPQGWRVVYGHESTVH